MDGELEKIPRYALSWKSSRLGIFDRTDSSFG